MFLKQPETIEGPFQQASNNLYAFADNFMFFWAVNKAVDSFEAAEKSDSDGGEMVKRLAEQTLIDLSNYLLEINKGVWD